MSNTRKCNPCGNPQTQNDGIECDGNFILDECVTLSQPNIFLNLPAGSKLSQFIGSITQAVKQIQTILNRKIDYTNLPTFNTNQDAINGGLTINKPYKTPTGEVRVVV